MTAVNLYDLPATPAAATNAWCGGNQGGDNEQCVTTTQMAGAADAFIVGDNKPEGAGHTLRMTGSELDAFAAQWVKARGLAL